MIYESPQHVVTVVWQRKKLKSGRKVKYAKLRWANPAGGFKTKSLGKGRTKTQIERARQQHQHDLNNGRARPEGDGRAISLARLLEIYAEQRQRVTARRGYRKTVKRLGASTITDHLMTLRYLVERFGPAKTLGSITVSQAEGWINALADGRLTGARHANAPSGKPCPQTVRGHIRNARAIWNWAKKTSLLGPHPDNPFCEFESKPIETDAHEYRGAEEFEKILAKITSPGERALYGLCRVAGLRLGEALSLPWSGEAADRHGRVWPIGVDLDAGRIALVAPKTKQYREVPIEPGLDALLREAPVRAGTVCGLSGNNLHVRAARYCKWADIDKGRAFFQALRASRENDWKTEGIAEPTYCSWMGHTALVSRQHYVAPTDSEFAAATRKIGTAARAVG